MTSERTEVTPDAAVEETRRLLEAKRLPQAIALFTSLHPADQAELLSELAPEERAPLLPAISREALGEIVGYLEEEPRRAIVGELDPGVLGPLLDEVDRDVAVDVLHELPPERAQQTLALMRSAAEVVPLLPHADETAGGRMTSDYVALHRDWTVDQTLTYLRRTKPQAEQSYYLYVVGDDHRLEGVVSLRQLVVASPEERIGDLMTPEVVSVSTAADQEEVARQIAHYNFVALPVVDEERHLVGVISVDRAMDVAEEEATEDMYRMVGLGAEETVLSPVKVALRRRVPWLLVNLMTAFVAALTVRPFEGTISKVAALAVFMPVVAGHGGNTGTQTTTLVVRGLALGEVRVSDVSRVVVKEIAFGLVHGLIVGALTAALALLLTGNGWLGFVVFVAMLGNVFIAGIAGSLIPLFLRTIRVDPALAAAIWLTTFTDVMGFLLLLGLGAALIGRLD